jgi:hypothetical protein
MVIWIAKYIKTLHCKLGLAQMVRFLVVEPTHPGLNPRFDVSVSYLRLIILSVIADVLIDNKTFFDRLNESRNQINPDF